MSLRNQLNDPSALLRFGLVCLILASVVRWFLHPEGGLGLELSDGLMGLLYGLSIALILQAVRLGGRQRCRNAS